MKGMRSSFAVRRALRLVAESGTIRRHVLLCTEANLALLVVGFMIRSSTWSDSLTAWISCGSSSPWAKGASLALRHLLHLSLSVTAYAACLIATTLWTSAIARAAAARTAPIRRATTQQAPPVAAANSLADAGFWVAPAAVLVRLLVTGLATATTVVLDPIPLVGRLVSLPLCAFVYSFSAHDAVDGLRHPVPPLEARLQRAEGAWAYHIGFGLVAAALTFSHYGWVVNGAMYGLLQPWLVLLAATSQPPTVDANRDVSGYGVPLLWPFKVASLWIAKGASVLVERRKSRSA